MVEFESSLVASGDGHGHGMVAGLHDAAHQRDGGATGPAAAAAAGLRRADGPLRPLPIGRRPAVAPRLLAPSVQPVLQQVTAAP